MFNRAGKHRRMRKREKEEKRWKEYSVINERKMAE
jgi:hypothetical protein